METQITTLNFGALPINLGEFYGLPATHPQATANAEIPLLCFCVSHQGRLVMIDAVGSPDTPADPASPSHTQPLPLRTQLSRHQIAAGAVTDVIITHTHWDHYHGLTQKVNGQFVPLFPHARHIINAADWHPEEFGALEEQTLHVVAEQGLLTLITGRMELDAGLTILPAPGETPGHQIVALDTGEQMHYFCGDLFHHPIEFEDLSLIVPWADPEMMTASKMTLLTAAAGNGGLLHFAHIAGAYSIVCRGEKFLFQKQNQ